MIITLLLKKKTKRLYYAQINQEWQINHVWRPSYPSSKALKIIE
jgi:hypothetical protein